MKKRNANLFRKLVKSVSVLSIFSVLVVAGCSGDDDGQPMPFNPDAPTVLTTDPGVDGIDIARDKSIAIVFSAEMDAETINASTFTLMHGTTEIPGTVSYANKTAVFVPSNTLASNSLYTAKIHEGAKDLEGTAVVAMEWNFTTIADESASVVSTDPAMDDIDIMRSKTISVAFSAEMDAETITAETFTLMHGTTTVAGTVSYSGKTAVFVPENALAANSIYIAKISSEVKTLNGTALEAKTWTFKTISSLANLSAVDLGAAANYAILAKTGISTVPTSKITGDIAVSPNNAESITDFSLTHFTGYAESDQVSGKVYAAEMAAPTSDNLTTAVENMLTAYTDAAGRPDADFFELYTGDISGKTLEAGLYKWTNTVVAPTDFTISGGADDIWIFQIAGDLKLSSDVKITLADGAQAKNIFWQVAGEAVFEAGSHFEGIVLSQTAVHLRTGATMNGLILAQSAVTLQSSTVTQPTR